jgi:hypothetical protein
MSDVQLATTADCDSPRPPCPQGALLGGFIGDRMARRLPDSGRIFTAQFSVASGIPLTWLLLKGGHAALAAALRAPTNPSSTTGTRLCRMLDDTAALACSRG